ncbi:ribonuclease E inhibitor RraA/Dimethylmenaquinone methyltransferase [Mycena belliarum]|uniref:Ribonuclease E inhibitor RraA/Dimethylmenaquinone methyltransferase n=1 Tax=Mycena belliarum TaxID=1033014 RepID=A0AAD6TYZ5_9AGAR|nr:ribonuclease E inhibitor RraA/Dimethylmenaquinone methyltransferase [Mycena belliae]
MSVSRLAAYSTCELSDALVKLGVAAGGFLPGLHLVSSGTVCAPAYTVKMVFNDDPSAPKLAEHFVDTAPAGSVIVIDAPHQAQNAVWGGLMSAGAIARSAVGVVISGRCRDLAEHRALNFPVFARSHSTLGQQPFTRPSAVNVPLVIGPPTTAGDYKFPATRVEPGDWIVGDEDGVVCVPQALEEKVLDLARLGKSVDALCLADIQAGKGIQATFAKHRGTK